MRAKKRAMIFLNLPIEDQSMSQSTAVIKAEPNKSGVYKVVEASEKGLGKIKARTRDEFNGLLMGAERLQGRPILVRYPDETVTLQPKV